jgi:uncharacterized metal-binding protein
MQNQAELGRPPGQPVSCSEYFSAASNWLALHCCAASCAVKAHPQAGFLVVFYIVVSDLARNSIAHPMIMHQVAVH